MRYNCYDTITPSQWRERDRAEVASELAVTAVTGEVTTDLPEEPAEGGAAEAQQEPNHDDDSLDISIIVNPYNPRFKESGACKGVDPKLFQPSRGESTDEAKQACKTCTVVSDCLEFMIETGDPGIGGGMNEKERKVIVAQRRAAAGLTGVKLRSKKFIVE